MTTIDAKEESDRIANSYWQARWAHDEDEAKRIWDSLGDHLESFRERTYTHDGVTLPEDVRNLVSHDRVTTEPEKGCTRWSGHTPFDLWNIDGRLTKIGFVFHEACCNGYRGVWSRSGTAYGPSVVITYCEGDLSIEVFTDEAKCLNHVLYLNAYYERSES